MSSFRIAALVGLVISVAAGCNDDCDPHATNTALAPRPAYDTMINTCITQKVCVPLCSELFALDPAKIEDCKIYFVDAANARVKVRVRDTARCEGGDDAYFDWGDDWYGGDDDDDGGDVCYGDCDDDSGDDGSTSSGDTGGGDDTGDDDDDGGDSGGGDDDDVAPHRAQGSAKSYTLAPPIAARRGA